MKLVFWYYYSNFQYEIIINIETFGGI